MRNITYAIDLDTGLVISRVGSELAWPILQYIGIRPENLFATQFQLEKIELLAAIWCRLKWTRKIPVEIKNIHRRFWGFKELKIRGKNETQQKRT